MAYSILDQFLGELPGTIWQKIAEIDGLKGQWVGEVAGEE